MTEAVDPFAARAVIATSSRGDFERYFGARLGDNLFVFDQGRTALEACGRLRPRHVFCDTTALSDGFTGYRLAMRLRAAHRDLPMPSMYLFGETKHAHDKRPLLDSLGIDRILPCSPVVVAWILGDLPRGADVVAQRDRAAPQGHDAPPRIAACNALLHRVLGPVAAKVIARASQGPAPFEHDVAAYVTRLAAEITVPEPRDEFLSAARQLCR